MNISFNKFYRGKAVNIFLFPRYVIASLKKVLLISSLNQAKTTPS